MRCRHSHAIIGRVTARGAYAVSMALGIVFTASAGVAAFGLRTPFIEVNLGCLKPGHTYSIVENRNLPLSVTNMGKVSIELAIEVVRPRAGELCKGYEPVPDTSWISLQQNRFQLEPGKNAITDVLVTVPDDKRYLGQNFQVWLYSYAMNRGGVQVGLKSRLLFSVCEG